MAANPPGQGSHDAAADVLLRTIWFLFLKASIHVQLLDDLLFRYTRNAFIQFYESFFPLSAFPNKARVAILAELEKERKRLIQNPSTGR